MHQFDDYSKIYKFVKFVREDGILQVSIHRDGGPAVWSGDRGEIHDELGDAFYRLGRDPENKIVILTGTGDSFLTETVTSEVTTADSWDRIYKEGKDLINNLLEIEVPVIGAVNGPAFVHAELLTLSDIVIASERAVFADKAHVPNGTTPSDGVHVWWPMILGPNRARHFLLTGAEIGAEEAHRLGFVAEVVPHERLLDRAWEVARELVQKPPLMLRYTRVAMTQHIKRRMIDDLGYGLMLEGMGVMSVMGK